MAASKTLRVMLHLLAAAEPWITVRSAAVRPLLAGFLPAAAAAEEEEVAAAAVLVASEAAAPPAEEEEEEELGAPSTIMPPAAVSAAAAAAAPPAAAPPAAPPAVLALLSRAYWGRISGAASIPLFLILSRSTSLMQFPPISLMYMPSAGRWGRGEVKRREGRRKWLEGREKKPKQAWNEMFRIMLCCYKRPSILLLTPLMDSPSPPPPPLSSLPPSCPLLSFSLLLPMTHC